MTDDAGARERADIVAYLRSGAAARRRWPWRYEEDGDVASVLLKVADEFERGYHVGPSLGRDE